MSMNADIISTISRFCAQKDIPQEDAVSLIEDVLLDVDCNDSSYLNVKEQVSKYYKEENNEKNS